MTNRDPFSTLAEDDDPLDAVAPPRSRISSSPIPLVSPVTAAVGIASIQAARRRGDHRPTFHLQNTGGVALVKRPSMLALANSGALPANLRPMIEAVVIREIRTPTDEVQKALDTFDLNNMIELIDATCIEGFINPMLVPDDHVKDPSGEVKKWPGPDKFLDLEQEGWVRCNRGGQVYDQKVMYLSEIDPDDRFEFFGWCNGRSAQEAQAVAPFPANGEDAVSPAPGRAGVSQVHPR